MLEPDSSDESVVLVARAVWTRKRFLVCSSRIFSSTAQEMGKGKGGRGKTEFEQGGIGRSVEWEPCEGVHEHASKKRLTSVFHDEAYDSNRPLLSNPMYAVNGLLFH